MRYLLVLILLSGCATRPGNVCAEMDTFVGQQIHMTHGGLWTVKRIYGPSERCTETMRPILVDAG